MSEISSSVLYCFPVPWCVRSRFWDWVLMTVMISWGWSLQMGKGKKGEDDWLWEDNCSHIVLSLKKPSTNNKTLPRTFGNLKEMWKSSKFSICRNAFLLFMFVISALEFPSGWHCLAWSDFNPLQKAFLNFPLLTSHFFFASNESLLFQGKRRSFFCCLVTIFLSSYHLQCDLCCWSLHFLCHSKVMGDTCNLELTP